MKFSHFSAVAVAVIALSSGIVLSASAEDDLTPVTDPGLPDSTILIIDPSAVWTENLLSPVGEAMKNTAFAAIPVGIEVMAVTAGIPVAKKVIKQLGK